MEDIFVPDEELGKAPVVKITGKGKERGKIEVSITPKAIYVKALAKNELFLNFRIEEIRLFQGKYTAVLKPIGFRKSPLLITRQYRGDIALDNVVIPERYRERVENMLEMEEEVATTRSKGGRGRGEHLLIEEYYLPILESLAEKGGRGVAREVIDRVYEKIKDKLKEEDKSFLKSGQRFWINRTQWARLRLVHKGYLRDDSPTGIWELSEEGWSYLKELKRGRSY